MLHYILETGASLHHEVECYCHAKYYPMGDPRSTVDYVNELKNDNRRHSLAVISCYEKQLTAAIVPDFARLAQVYGPMLVCGIPRSKRTNSYSDDCMGLKRGIRAAVRQVSQLSDGLDCIVRHTDTKTTHLKYSGRFGYGGNGEMPRPGITRDTCSISPEVAGKTVLLVDDIYTPGVGIDEDAVQALLDAGASRVIFYAVGKAMGTMSGYRLAA